MTSNQRSVLVLGAGELGTAVLRSLAIRAARHPGTTLTVLLRPSTVESQNATKQLELATFRSLGIKILPGDLAACTVAQLSALFQPFDTVISCTGFVGGSGTQLKLARAMLEAGVRRYFPWQFGVDYDVIGRGSAQELFDEQLDVRDLLRAQHNTEWVILSTGMFTSFLFEPSFGVVDLIGSSVHALGSFENAVTVTTAEDIGVLTAEAVFAEPRITNQILYTAGDTITYARLADILSLVTGREVHRAEWDVEKLQNELAREPESALKKYRVVFAMGRGVFWDKENTFNAQRGIETMDVEHWLAGNLKT